MILSKLLLGNNTTCNAGRSYLISIVKQQVSASRIRE
jgi:hypothetical protein